MMACPWCGTAFSELRPLCDHMVECEERYENAIIEVDSEVAAE